MCEDQAQVWETRPGSSQDESVWQEDSELPFTRLPCRSPCPHPFAANLTYPAVVNHNRLQQNQFPLPPPLTKTWQLSKSF